VSSSRLLTQCFRHRRAISTSILRKLVNGGANLNKSELKTFHPAATAGAEACGFTYLGP